MLRSISTVWQAQGHVFDPWYQKKSIEEKLNDDENRAFTNGRGPRFGRIREG